MTSQHRIGLDFDTALLQADLARLWDAPWVAHFNTGYYQGGWSGIALRQTPDRDGSLIANAEPDAFVDTPALTRCRYLPAVLDAFLCQKASVRLLRLDPGGRIREHRDYDLGVATGKVRVHVPILTNAAVDFFVANRRVVMAAGEAWYLDLSQPHRVRNRGAEPRVHLVLDLLLNDWLTAQLPATVAPADQAAPYPPPQPSPEKLAALEAFRDTVRADPALQADLAEIEDRSLFIDETLRIAAAHGFDITAVEVEATLRAEQQRWHAEAWP